MNMSVDRFSVEDVWELVREFIPEQKRKEVANRVIDIFEDEDVDFDYDDIESQILIDAELVEFDEDEDDETQED